MLYSKLSAVLLAAITCASVSYAAPVTLKSTSGGIELKGELLSFENGFYVLETALGALDVDARTVTCLGDACPKDVSNTSEFTITGNDRLLKNLILPLIEGYGFSLGADVALKSSDKNKSSVQVTGINGTKFADISIGGTQKNSAINVLSGTVEKMLSAKSTSTIVPLSSDAFVLAVSADNPLRSISQKNLQALLSGKITNWKDIGGPDFDINLYVPSGNNSLLNTAKATGFDFSKAKKLPDLETPHCTSSKISNIFFLLHNFLNSFKHQSGTTLIPPSPIIGSIIIAAVFLVIFFFKDL